MVDAPVRRIQCQAMDFACRMTRQPIPHDVGAGEEAALPFAGLGPQIGSLLVGAAGCSPYLRDLMRREEGWLREALAGPPEESLARLIERRLPASSRRACPKRCARPSAAWRCWRRWPIWAGSGRWTR